MAYADLFKKVKEQNQAAAQTSGSKALSLAAENLRKQRETFQREQRAAFISTPSPQPTVQSPQSQRSYLKETQMAKQDNAAQYQAAPASSLRQYGNAAPYSGMTSDQLRNQRDDLAKIDYTLAFLNQNGVNTKYTQDIAQENRRQLDQTQTALKQAVEQEKPRSNSQRDSLIRQLEELNRYSGYAVTTETNDAYQQQRQAILDQIHAQDEALGNRPRSYDAQDRTEKTVGGSMKQYGGDVVNSGVTFLDFQGKYQSGILTQEDVYVAQAMGLSLEEYGKLKQQSYNSQQTRDAFDRGYALADRLSEAGARDIATAQEGLNEWERFGIDVASNIVQMIPDAVGRSIGLGKLPLFIHAAGGGAREARQDGASLEQQVLYGAAKGGIEVGAEMMFDGLAGIFGKGKFDNVVENVIRKFAKTDAGRTFFRVLFSGPEEGLEEVFSDLADPFAKLIYNNQALKEAWENRGELAEQMLYDYLVGCAIGTVGSAGSIVTGQDAQKNTEARQRDTAEWLESEALENQQRDALEMIREANRNRSAQTGMQSTAPGAVAGAGQYTAANQQAGTAYTPSNAYVPVQNSGANANFQPVNSTFQTVPGRMQSQTNLMPQISAAGSPAVSGQVLQNAGTNGKIGLGNENNRNTGNINPVTAFQPGSQESRSRDGNTQNAA